MNAPELNAEDGIPKLFMHFLHPEANDLAVVGMIQPDSGQWGITDLQSQVIARMILANRSAHELKHGLKNNGKEYRKIIRFTISSHRDMHLRSNILVILNTSKNLFVD